MSYNVIHCSYLNVHPMSDDRKDYIINLRVSRKTYEKLKARASENRETMSNLARKVIDDGMEIIGDVSDELLGKDKKNTDVCYTYEVHLAKDDVCNQCGCVLKKGKKVIVGEKKSGRKYCFCTKCHP